MKLPIKQTAIALALGSALVGAHATTLGLDTASTSVDYSATSFSGVLLDSAITNISNSSYNGVARTAVYDTGTGLDFYYQFSNNTTSKNGVGRMTGYDFSSLGASTVETFQTDAAFGIFVVGTEKSDASDRTSFGVVGFNFVPGLSSKVNPGTTSFTQVIRTNARTYAAGNFGLINGIGDNAAGFAPSTLVSAVPEPETYAMLLAGLGLIGAVVRRRS